jgi:ribonuclease-3
VEITLQHVASEIDRRAHAPGVEDFKTRLQEVLAKKGSKPEYRISDEGPDHDKVFHAEVLVDGRLIGSGSGSSKKSAEQAAAEKALRMAK